MRKCFTLCGLHSLLVSLIWLVALSLTANADDNFAMAIGSHDHLVIFGTKGDRVAELTIPTISQSVTVGSTSFQVSYGRDANEQLTAIVAPSSSGPQDLHFNVANKNIDADKEAVVTLTFRDANHVSVDPGYVGKVAVNAQAVEQHAVVKNTPAPTPHAASAPTLAPRTSANVQPRELPPAPAPHEEKTPADAAPKPAVQAAEPETSTEKRESTPTASDLLKSPVYDTDSSPAPPAGNPGGIKSHAPPLMGGIFSQPPINNSVGSSDGGGKKKLYWSEPITPPNGSPPQVGVDEMKVVEVKGPVSIKLANGETQPAQDGMILPSGSTVMTSSNSSAAVFMGGVNSTRLMPDTAAKITQHLDGSVRHTSIDLDIGSIFSRVGRRVGETEDYQVRTPEGVAAARGTDFMDHRGKGNDGKMHHYVFVAKGLVECFVQGQVFKLVAGKIGDLGSTVMPPTDDAMLILVAVLEALQPFNDKLEGVLERMNDGTATTGDIAFYNTLVNTFFGVQLPGLINLYDDSTNPLLIIPAARRALNQDLQPFGTNPTSGF